MWHPWRRLRELAHVEIVRVDTDAELGHFDFGTMTVALATDLNQAERRSTLTHELIHYERGAASAEHREAEDVIVRRLTAERLIPLDALVDALLWAGNDEHQIAEELWVDVGVVRDRLASMSVADRKYVETELDRREPS